MRFPFPLGDGGFFGETRQETAESFLDRLTGKGGFGDDPDLVIVRTRQGLARGISSISLTCDRLLEQIFPGSAHPDDHLGTWEDYLHVVRRQPDTMEERQAEVGKVLADRSGFRTGLGEGAGRGNDTKRYLEEVVGLGNCTYRFNKMAFLVANGYDPRGIYAVAFELPLSEIATIGQLERLRGIVNRHKPAHVGVATTRRVDRGFLADDAPESLVDRDVVRI